jgi:hypothetical protein
LSTAITSVGIRATSQMRSIVRCAISASSGLRLHTGMLMLSSGSTGHRAGVPSWRSSGSVFGNGWTVVGALR